VLKKEEVIQMNDIYFFCELAEKYLDQSANLLNTEWPRSVSQRHLSLTNFISSEFNTDPCGNDEHEFKLPISLLLINRLEDRVIGHASLLQIAVKNNDGIIENLAFLQSLIVDKELRGKGLGKKMMSYCELYMHKYAKRQNKLKLKEMTNCDYLYLTTKDKQLFYESIGYIKTEPLLFYSVKNSKSRCNRIMNELLASFNTNEPNQIIRQNNQENTHVIPNLPVNSSIPLPPPPPPLPPPSMISKTIEIDKKKDNSYIVAESYWYRKPIINSKLDL
jgi:GNAT superfamily N-acetyltransferase